MEKIRHLVAKRNRDGTFRFYWQPAAALKAEGWPTVALRSPAGAWLDRFDAARAAQAINEWLDAWRAGAKALPAFAGCTPFAPARATATGPQGNLTTVKFPPGSVGALVAAYKADEKYRGLADATRKAYATYLDMIVEWAGDAPAAAVTRDAAEAKYRALGGGLAGRDVEWVARVRGVSIAKAGEILAAARPRKASYFVQVLRLLLGWGRNRTDGGFNIAVNVCEGIGLSFMSEPSIILPWEFERLFVDAADGLGLHSVGTALMLNNWLGQREKDILALPRVQYHGGKLTVWQSKTGKGLRVPIDRVPHVAERIEAELARQKKRGEVGPTLLMREGQAAPWGEDAFRKAWAEIRAAVAKQRDRFTVDFLRKGATEADVVETWELQFRYTRHTMIVRSYEAGVPAENIAALSGHTRAQVNQVVEHYLVRTTEMAADALDQRLAYETVRYGGGDAQAAGGEG